jgi:ribulose-phosphate 3-epimerase
MKVAVSFISSLYDEEKTINKIDSSIADYLHVDIMDGEFVPVKNYSYSEIFEWTKNISKPLDIHLMVNEPLNEIINYAKLKPAYITFHIEATKEPLSIINYLRGHNIKVGIAINPETSIASIMPYLNMIDLVLVMSVVPGKGGQDFIKDTIPKINKLKSLQKEYHYLVSVDGGINDQTIKDVNSDIVVSGSFICKYPDYNSQIKKLHY